MGKLPAIGDVSKPVLEELTCTMDLAWRAPANSFATSSVSPWHLPIQLPIFSGTMTLQPNYMNTRSMRMKKKIPTLKSDRAAAAFVDKADLTQYDLSGATLTRFEIKPKDKSFNLRLSGELYDAVRKRAARAGVPYQRFIRLTLEQAIGGPK